MSMIPIVVRFGAGGALIAVIPLIAQRTGPAVSGVALLFPATSVAGLLFLGLSQGTPTVARAAVGAVIGIPTVLAFLLGVVVAARRGLPVGFVLAVGAVCWFAAAAPTVLVIRSWK